jgi:hypothetical protein
VTVNVHPDVDAALDQLNELRRRRDAAEQRQQAAEDRTRISVRHVYDMLTADRHTAVGRRQLADYIASMEGDPAIDGVFAVSADYRFLVERHLVNEAFRGISSLP